MLLSLQTQQVMHYYKINNLYLPEWNLLEKMIGVVKVQSDSLKSLKPTISYIVNNSRYVLQQLTRLQRYNIHCRAFTYNTDEDGHLLAIDQCQCLPESGNTSITATGVQFTCPAGKASRVDGQVCVNKDF